MKTAGHTGPRRWLCARVPEWRTLGAYGPRPIGVGYGDPGGSAWPAVQAVCRLMGMDREISEGKLIGSARRQLWPVATPFHADRVRIAVRKPPVPTDGRGARGATRAGGHRHSPATAVRGCTTQAAVRAVRDMT